MPKGSDRRLTILKDTYKYSSQASSSLAASKSLAKCSGSVATGALRSHMVLHGLSASEVVLLADPPDLLNINRRANVRQPVAAEVYRITYYIHSLFVVMQQVETKQ